MSDEKQDARGWDSDGNVRPADDRFLLAQPEEGDPSAEDATPEPLPKARKRR